MNNALALLLLIVSAPLSSPASAAGAKAWVLDLGKGTGEVSFDAVGKPSALKIHGKGEAPKGELKIADGKLKGACTFKLDTLDTGIALRNKHMKERYLEVGKNPEAQLTFDDLALPENHAADDFSADALPFKGKLSLHGTEKPVEGVAKVARKGETVSIEAGMDLKTADFGIKTPSFAGVTMGEDVKVKVRTTSPFRSE